MISCCIEIKKGFSALLCSDEHRNRVIIGIIKILVSQDINFFSVIQFKVCKLLTLRYYFDFMILQLNVPKSQCTIQLYVCKPHFLIQLLVFYWLTITGWQYCRLLYIDGNFAIFFYSIGVVFWFVFAFILDFLLQIFLWFFLT